MPKIIVRGNVVASGSQFQLEGFPRQAVTSVFVQEGIIERETEIQITGIPVDPPPELSAVILGLPLGNQAQELTTITTLSAEVRDEEGTVVELYDPAEWTWAVGSGGGSFGGPNGDELTLPAAPASVEISATHDEQGLVDTATIAVVATVAFTPEFYNLPAQIIQGQQSNPLRSRVLDSDGSTVEEVDTNWSYSIVSGPGSISGPIGNQVLIANAGSAGQSITVRATYMGSLNVSPATDDQTTSVVQQPGPDDFPEVLQPAGHTVIESLDGSSKIWAGWNQSDEWTSDNTRVEVVSDPLSKFGNAVEKRFFFGEAFGGWKGFSGRHIGLWRELYVRLVFKMSSNFEWHSSGGKYLYLHNSGAGAAKRNIILGTETNSTPANNAFDLDPDPGRAISFVDFSTGLGQWIPNLPRVSRGEYHTVEHLIGADLGTNDGYLRQAVDGVEAVEWVLVGGGGETRDLRSGQNWTFNDNVSDKRIGAQVEAFLFNGGSGGTVPADINIRLSELFISGRN